MIDPRRPDFGRTPASLDGAVYRYALRENESPVLSIVTPFFDTGDVFHETATAVFAQSLQAWEWIIVNDGSSDRRALEGLERYRSHPRIVVIDLPARTGPAAARNVAAARARTPYLLLLDSDDLIEPTAAEKWWWFLESYREYAFVKGFSVGFGEMEYLATTGFHDGAAFLDRNLVDITSLIRADAFHAVNGFPADNRGGLEDWEFWLRCATAGKWGGTVPEYLSWYRRRADDAARWPHWQGDSGSPRVRDRLRRQFAGLYADPTQFPAPRPAQLAAHTPEDSPGINRLARDGRRLLLVVPWFAVGGSDAFNLDLIRHLTGAGWEVTVAATLQGADAWLPAFSSVTPDVFSLPNFLRLSDYPRFLRYLIQSRDVDVVMVTNSELGYRLLPYLRRGNDRVSFIDFCHMEEEDWQDGGYPRQSIDAAAFLDRSIVLSEHLRQWMVARGRPPGEVVVSHNGVAVPSSAEIASARTRVRTAWSAEAVPVLLFAGRVVEQKQPAVFVEAAIQLAREGIAFMVVIAGDGPKLTEMRERLDRAGLSSRVRVLGAMSREELGDVMCGADVLCLPSRWEGISLAVQEAMARGVAVVTADVGGQAELVTDGCGILVSPAAPEAQTAAYADALRPLLTNEGVRQAMGQQAQARVSTGFRLDQMGARMERLLIEAIDMCAAQHVHARSSSNHTSGATETVAREVAGIVDDLQAAYMPHWRWVASVVEGRSSAPPTLTARAFKSLTILEPAYRWGLRHGWTWLPAVRRRLRGPVRRVLRLDR